MKRYAYLLLTIYLAWACTSGTGNSNADQNLETENRNPRLVTLGGTISEIVWALGRGESIVATDPTSTYPAELRNLPSVGYRQSIKAEGILSTGAERVLAEEDYLNPDLVTQLEHSGLAFHTVKNETSLQSTRRMISEIGDILGTQTEARNLIAALDRDAQRLDSLRQHFTSKPKVMIVYARGQGALSVCGTESFAGSMVELAGGTFATPEISDYKPLTPEALVAANPDYIMFFESGLQSLGGVDGALTIPGITQTTAGKQRNIIAMDGLYLSGFGPRAAKAAYDLARMIHPELQTTQTSTASLN
jgi:iron complex transport system substrate-binding protein